MRFVLSISWVVGVFGVCGCGGQPESSKQNFEPNGYETLSQAGFLGNAPGQVAKGFQPYVPQYPLWSDGAKKYRWIFLPKNSQINNQDPDQWIFPRGTRLVKEFRYGAIRVETRLIEKSRCDADTASIACWDFYTFEWRKDQTDAFRIEMYNSSWWTDGHKTSYLTSYGTKHVIPTMDDCRMCHNKGGEPVLGFSSLQLSDERDPLALHAMAVSQDDVTLGTLVDHSRLRNRQPREVKIPARSDVERAALGYLHANCGHCHNPQGMADAQHGFDLYLHYDRLAAKQPALETAVDQLTYKADENRPGYQIPGRQGLTYRIKTCDIEASAIYDRMRYRYPTQDGPIPMKDFGRPMPMLGTEVADSQALELMADWINQLPCP